MNIPSCLFTASPHSTEMKSGLMFHDDFQDLIFALSHWLWFILTYLTTLVLGTLWNIPCPFKQVSEVFSSWLSYTPNFIGLVPDPKLVSRQMWHLGSLELVARVSNSEKEELELLLPLDLLTINSRPDKEQLITSKNNFLKKEGAQITCTIPCKVGSHCR